MAAELSFPVAVRGLPIVRELDGLALSSRNTLLNNHDRSVALGLSSSLFAACAAFEAGERSTSVLCGIVLDHLGADAAADVEYVSVARASDAQLVDDVDVISFLALAARIGDVRLIDNVFLDPNTESADRGVRLTKPTILYGDD
jgi:pantoate--beta-alanine ligase